MENPSREREHVRYEMYMYTTWRAFCAKYVYICTYIYQAKSIVDEQWRKRRSITNSRWKISSRCLSANVYREFLRGFPWQVHKYSCCCCVKRNVFEFSFSGLLYSQITNVNIFFLIIDSAYIYYLICIEIFISFNIIYVCKNYTYW